jgi:5-methylcytosine-specific restriction endonuclease McrA
MCCKTCSKCGESKPATAEFFTSRRDSKDGFRARCKECHYATTRRWIKRNIDVVRDGRRVAQGRYRESHHAEILAAWRNRYAADEAFRKLHSERRMAHARAHPDMKHAAYQAWRTRNRDELLARQREHRAEHPSLYRAYKRRRRATRYAADGRHTAEDVAAQYGRQRGKCYWCHEKVGGTYHVDHIVPLSRGGGDGPENLVIACPHCNCSKHTKLPHEFSDRLC